MALVQMSPGLICVTHFSVPLRTSSAMIAHDSGVSRRGSSGVGRRGAVLTSVPKKIVSGLRVERRGAPDRARRRPEMKDVVAAAVLDRDRRLQRLGLGAQVVFPEIWPVFGLERDHEAAARAGPGRTGKPR